MKNAQTSYHLDVSQIQGLGGIIGIAACPGSKDDKAAKGMLPIDLSTELDAIENWGAAAVVTLDAGQEFDQPGALDLPNELPARFEWHHISMSEQSALDQEAETAWARISEKLLNHLHAGKKILLLSKAGKGRAATMAARLLMDGGMSAGMAIDAVRTTLPSAISKPAQARYLRTHPSHLAHASLVGTAIGDSLGADIEFLSLRHINIIFPDKVDRLTEAYGKLGAITDDTQMALFTAEGIIRARSSRKYGVTKAVHHSLLQWLVSQGMPPKLNVDRNSGLLAIPELHARRAPGNTCLAALEGAVELGAPAKNNSKGCGTIMRVAPIAFGVPREQVRELAITTSALTHGHVTGQLAAAFWAELVADCLEKSDDVERAARHLLDQYRDLAGSGEVIDAVEAALVAPRDGAPATVEHLGGGWVAEECLAIALYAVLASANAADSLSIAVKHSGDSDSCGAVAGALLGVLYPEQVLQSSFANQIELAEVIRKISKDLAFCAG